MKTLRDTASVLMRQISYSYRVYRFTKDTEVFITIDRVFNNDLEAINVIQRLRINYRYAPGFKDHILLFRQDSYPEAFFAKLTRKDMILIEKAINKRYYDYIRESK